MIKDLVNVSQDEISESAARSVESDNTVVVYLQNNGNKDNELNNNDLRAWINEDIDE